MGLMEFFLDLHRKLFPLRTFAHLSQFAQAMRQYWSKSVMKAGHQVQIYIAGFDEDDQPDAFIVETGYMVSARPIEGFAAAPMPPADDPIYA
jgi:hypothetical protein